MAKALSISILFLITQLNGQQGYGCAVKTCPIPGQVRTNIVTNAEGQYLSGCECVAQYLSIPHVWTAQPPQIEPQRPIGIPITVTCDGTGQTETPCQCPPDHIGECKILCEGTQDACKDVSIKCNNGYACIVDCIAPNACSSGTIINGPSDASLTVNCLGEKSCETNTIFNGRSGTDLTVICNGVTSCKEASFNFGKGMGKVECNGYPDACINAKFNLLSGQRGFKCIGCPPDAPKPFEILPPTWSPTPGPTNQPTNKPTHQPSVSPTPAPTVATTICDTPGNCECLPGGGCLIECINNNDDACKDGLIKCNNNGFPCVVNCITMNSCSGATTIIGPVGASLTVNCKGSKSCEGGFIIDAADSTNTQFICRGNEACKGGSVVFYFGTGINYVACSGQPDSCLHAQFILPYTGAVAFECVGINCPAIPANFNNAIQPIQIQPIQTVTIQPVQPQISGTHCCITSLKSWRGRCWKATTQTECNKVNTRKCSWIWDTSSCLPNPPINTFGKVCKYNGDGCNDATDCCSEVCISQSQTCS